MAEYMQKYNLKLDRRFDEILGFHTKKEWSSFIKDDNKKYCTELSLDFLDKLLRYDPEERLTTAEAMEHPFIAGMRSNDAGK